MHKEKINEKKERTSKIFNSKIFFMLLNLVFLQFFAGIGIASATTYYVSPIGNDARDGMSLGNAWATIQKCGITLVAGDTCKIQAGTYSDKVIPSNSGTNSKWINYIGEGMPVIQNAQIIISSKSYINITGITVTGDMARTLDNFDISGSDHINLINVKANRGYRPIHIYAVSSNILVDGAFVWDAQWSAISVNTHSGTTPNRNITIKNSIAHDTDHNGIDIHTYVEDVLLENNTIYNVYAGNTGIYVHNWGVYRVRVINNTIYNTTYLGIAFIGSHDSIAKGNHLSNIKRHGLIAFMDNNGGGSGDTGNTNITFQDNIVDGVTDGGYNCGQVGETIEPTMINDGIIFINNTFSNCAMSEFGVGGEINKNVIIKDQNPTNGVIKIQKITTLPQNAVFEYSKGRIFTEDDANIPYWYQDKSNMTLSNLGITRFTVYNSTLNTTSKVTVTAFSNSAMSLDYYNQNISYVNFTLDDSVTAFKITLNNIPSGLNLFLYDAKGNLIDNKIASSGTVYFNVGLSDGSYYIKQGAKGPYGNGSGTITNITSGAPIIGATVTDGVKNTTTDGFGKFFLDNILTGSRTITASKTGYQAASKLIIVLENSTVTADFQLQPLIPPTITYYSPSNLSPTQDESSTETFNVITNQQVTNKWFLDSVLQSSTSQTYTKTWSYSDSGTHNITYTGKNANGTVSKTWMITVNNIADTMSPVITNVISSSITSSSATISWTTNEPATSQIEYGLNTNYGSSSVLDQVLTTIHSVTLTGLANNTTSHYRVKSRDADNNLANSNDYIFTTLPINQAISGIWRFDEGIGIIVADSSGNNNNGTVYSAVWTSGKLGSALQFNGNAYVSIPNSAALNPSNEITLEAWFKPSNIPQAGWNKIIAKPYTSSASPYQEYALTLNGDKVVFELNTEGTKDEVTSSITLAANTWYHLAGTYNGSEMRIYVNGILNGSKPKSGTIASYPTNLHIGAGIYSDSNREFISGTIDEVSILGTALSAEEIKAKYYIIFAPEDVNQDSFINQTDLDIIQNSINTNTPCQRCDVNSDGIVDIYDVTRVSVKV